MLFIITQYPQIFIYMFFRHYTWKTLKPTSIFSGYDTWSISTYNWTGTETETHNIIVETNETC